MSGPKLPPTTQWVGAAVPRKEDRRMLLGRGRFTGDLARTGTLHAEFTATRMPLLAGDQVRYVGEPVAVVIADDPYIAEDAAEVVEVDWTPLPAIAGLDAARVAGARQVHRELAGNCLVDLTMFDDDRLEEIFATAPVVVEGVFTSARVAALPMEGRACLADWDDRDEQL